MQFATPDALLLLLLLPGVAGLFLWAARRKRRQLEAFGDANLVRRLAPRTSKRRERLKPSLFLVGLFFLVVAMARPQWGRGTEEVVARGADIFILLDTSYSMDATDVAPSRMERARHIASGLMERLQGNRIGLVVFSGSAFVQCPLTLDYGAARIFLDTVGTGIVPEPGTDIVQAVEAARKAFVARSSKHRVVLLLTDGEQHEGDVMSVAESAREDGIVIHTVGVGTPGGEPIPVRNERGQVSDYVRGDDGQPILSRLDEATLREIAVATGGEYFRISDQDREIDELTERIMGMEGDELESQLFTNFEERFYWPLGLALVFLALEALIGREAKAEASLGEST